MKLSHNDLIKIAAKWLYSRANIIITEMAGIGEEADAIGFKNPYETILIECKASRNDFKSDGKKYFRREPSRGMGVIRYYLTPKDLINLDELPEGWGLLETTGKKVRVKCHGHKFRERDINKEMQMLISGFRRIGQNPVNGISAKVYSYETKNRCTIGIVTDEQIQGQEDG